MFFWVVYTILCLAVGILFGALIERHMAATAATEEMTANLELVVDAGPGDPTLHSGSEL